MKVKAKMSAIRLNLNEVIKVRLTDLGRDIFYHQYDKINQRCGKIICNPVLPDEDKEGYVTFQLWHFMSIYGDYIGMGKPNVIDPIEIIYELSAEITYE